jgi:hypothetical protein
MDKELNRLLIETEFGITKDIINHIFKNIEAVSQEELNIKAALLKQAFLNQFDIEFNIAFMNASEELIK